MSESNLTPSEFDIEIKNDLENESIGLEKVTSFEEMYAMLRKQKDIKGTQKIYLPEEVIKRIEQIRHGHRPIGFITRTYGIRSALERLLPNDKIFKKYTQKKK